MPFSFRKTMLRPSSLRQVTTGDGVPVALHLSRTLPPSSVVRPSAESSRSIMSGGMTTSMYPIYSKVSLVIIYRIIRISVMGTTSNCSIETGTVGYKEKLAYEHGKHIEAFVNTGFLPPITLSDSHPGLSFRNMIPRSIGDLRHSV